jgi:hypothetical protein
MFESVVALFFDWHLWAVALTRVATAELPDRTSGAALLPLNTKDKDSRTKEENHKLLNGNSGDPADWVW